MNLTKRETIDFIILLLRWYLAFYMVDYGIGKIMGEQFGVTPAMLEKPLKEVPKFYLAWYLFSLSKVFKIGIGIFQILGAILIVINRTALIGALMLLPILVSIFLIDVSFTMDMHGAALPVRLTGMILSDLLILAYYKDKVLPAFKTLTTNVRTTYKYPWWVFILLPIMGLLTDFVLGAAFRPVTYLLNICLK